MPKLPVHALLNDIFLFFHLTQARSIVDDVSKLERIGQRRGATRALEPAEVRDPEPVSNSPPRTGSGPCIVLWPQSEKPIARILYVGNRSFFSS